MAVPILRSLQIQNLLSFGPDCPALDLKALNVVIGPNGSGKSNLIETIGLLHSTPSDLSIPIRDGGGISEWLWKGGGRKIPRVACIDALVAQQNSAKVLRYKLSFRQAGYSLDIEDERIENERPVPGKPKPYFFFAYEKGHPVINVNANKRVLQHEDIDPRQSILSQRKDPDQYPEITYLGQIFSHITFYRDWEFGINAEARKISAPDQQSNYLAEDASNLALMINRMKADPPVKQRLISYLQDFYHEATDINAVIKESLVELRLEEKGGFTTPATRLSDGTLRWIAMLAILLNPTPPPLVCIEEPELGLHPDVIPLLARLLKEASENMQIIVTTHSDALVDEFTEDPSCVIVSEKHNGTTQFHRLDHSELSKWLSDYSLGMLWRKGEIGGTRW